MSDPPAASRSFPFLAALVLTAGVFSCALYANFSFAVTNPADYRFFPPFEPGVDRNFNRHLGAEYFNIARSLVAGKGFASPFQEPSGPTAWMPPVLPALLAALLWLCDSREAVMVVVVFLQTCVLVGTGLLILALARQTTRQLGPPVAVATFFVALGSDFAWCFQFTDDWWLILLAIDLLVAGLCWCRPLHFRRMAAVWGLFGGLCALVSPVVAFAWAGLSLLVALHHRCWARLSIAGLVAGLTLVPWTVRNYLVFGRLIPVKSNLAYELYQSQCLQPDGLLQLRTFRLHPYVATGKEGEEFKELGEMAFLDRKGKQFRQAIQADPAGFVERLAERFLGATLWYEPLDRTDKAHRPWLFSFSRWIHPLPFLALLVLIFTAASKGLHLAQWIVLGVYLLYLCPYIGVSYYDRYAVPLLGVKVLLVIWAADVLLSLLPTTGKTEARPFTFTQPKQAQQNRVDL